MKCFGFFLVLILLISCQDIEETRKPENLLSESKMVEVLTELSLLNSAKNYNKRFLEETGFRPEEFLLNKYNIDSLQLAESTTYYARNYTQFERIYEKVQRNLESLKNEFEIKKAGEQRLKDSIRELQKENDSIIIDSTFFKSRTRDSLIGKTQPRDREEF